MILTYYTTIEKQIWLNILDDSLPDKQRHIQVPVNLDNIMRLNTEGCYLISKANNVFTPANQAPEINKEKNNAGTE